MATNTTKRPSPSSELPQQKKARLFAPQREEDKPQTAAKVDPTYGQRGAFPGLDGNGEEELFYGPAEDGLAYLRMVRLEAKGVPNLLVAPKTNGNSEGNAEEELYKPYEARGEGWYSDGAYTAGPSTTAVKEEVDNQEDQDAQEAYYVALLDRFGDLRIALTALPPSSAQPLEPAGRLLFSDPQLRHWRHALLKSRPTPKLLCSLPQESVVLGIEELESLLTMRNLRSGVQHKLGAWAWGLLGRCRDVSEMDSEDVSILRGLGKKACALLRRLRAGEDVEEVEVEEEENDGKGDEVRSTREEIDTKEAGEQNAVEIGVPLDAEASLETARKQLLSALVSNETEKHKEADQGAMQGEDVMDARLEQVSDAHAALDMIVTIVGELYGQRDLLDGRLAWEEI